ncbi:MAG: STAS/SEC14 domain-containing protein [Candidatus Krumholzibacteria bacterium]|nr:STAS/SEC14 domain-containing protein [Candidatus Krumholzibacteria bacterium]
MGIEFRIDTEEGIVYTTVKGDLDVDDIIAGLTEIISHEDFEQGMGGIFDLLASKWESNPEELRKIVRFIIENTDRIGQSRHAVVVGSNRAYGMSRMFEVFSQETAVNVRIFRDLDEARKWMIEGADKKE